MGLFYHDEAYLETNKVKTFFNKGFLNITRYQKQYFDLLVTEEKIKDISE